MAAFADYMARVSASMIHAALANAAEKAAAAHQQQQGRDMGAPVAGGAGTACASSSLLPFFPLPLLALPPVVGQMHPQQQQQQNGTTAKGTDNVKMEEQRQQHNLGANATQQLANGKTTTTAKANRNGAGGGKTVMTTTALNNNGGGKQQQSEGEKPKPNKTQNDGPKKRKRPCPSAPITEELPKPQQQQQLTVKTEHQSSESPLSTSRISSPDSVHRSGSGRGARKLKLYVAEEKVDIIDYAKCIGNRAAGREFNVAESSIREWRKNEEKIRRQAESTLGCTQHFEQSQPDILAWIDEALVKTMVGEKGEQCTTTTAMDWYAIAAKARQLWTEKAHSTDHLDGSEMKVTMGWVSRFMRRNEHRVPKIAPPIIATGNATSSNSAATSCCSASTNGGSTARGSTGTAGLTMVKSTPLPVDTSDKKSEGMTRTKAARPKRMSRATAAGGVTPTEERPPQKRAKTTTTTAPNGPSKTNGTAQPRGTKGTSESGEDKMATQPTATDTATAATTPEQQLQTNAVPTSSARRRKCLKPMRVISGFGTDRRK